MRFIAVLLLMMLFAGCVGCDKEDVSHEKESPVVLFDETVKISAGEYRQWQFYASYNVKCHLEVISDNDVNIWLINASEIQHFEKYETFDYYPLASRKKAVSFTCDFYAPGSGFYCLIADNRYSILTPKFVSLKIVLG